jgi:predicted RNase H-like nuclease (RuvC/YqgF family)
MNFLLFGLFLVEFCSASRCRTEKDRIKELSRQKRELRIERNELKEENKELKRKLEAYDSSGYEVKEEFATLATFMSLFRKYDFTFSNKKLKTTTTRTEISTTATTATTTTKISTTTTSVPKVVSHES